MNEITQIRVWGDASLPTLVYLPGLHGDWTLITRFRLALADRIRFVEITYPRSRSWSIPEYVDDIAKALLDHEIAQGWLLGESFGSQFAWELLARNLPARAGIPSARVAKTFQVTGIILAGGFVKHPLKGGPTLLRWLGAMRPGKSKQLELKIYARYARWRHRHTPETRASLAEFLARRTDLDRQAIRHRLTLLDQYDPRPVARQTQVPVHYLAGLIDPLIPWPLVRRWLRHNCPGYRRGKTFWLADHNVLASAPDQTANLIIKWMNQSGAGAA